MKMVMHFAMYIIFKKIFDCKTLHMTEDIYVSMDSFNWCFDENSRESPSQMLAPLAPTDTIKSIEYITVKNNIYKK